MPLSDETLYQIFIGWILGCVEGLTEFIPVSSTGHMILVSENILHFTGETAETFEVIIQIGAGLAVVFAYRERFLDLARLAWNQIIPKKYIKTPTVMEENGKHLNIWHLVIACFPAALLGVLFHSKIKNLFNTEMVAIGIALGAILMLGAEFPRRNKKRPLTESLDRITYGQALWVGLFQCFSLWSGFSRAGSTIAGGLLVGMNHRTSAAFSFLVAVPMLAGACVLDLYKNRSFLNWNNFPLIASGLIVSFFVALITVNFFMRWLPKTKLWPFAVYRLVLAAALFSWMYLK